jgi:hypothetical protein
MIMFQIAMQHKNDPVLYLQIAEGFQLKRVITDQEIVLFDTLAQTDIGRSRRSVFAEMQAGCMIALAFRSPGGHALIPAIRQYRVIDMPLR